MNDHENTIEDHASYAGAYICGLCFAAFCGLVAGFVSAWVVL